MEFGNINFLREEGRLRSALIFSLVLHLALLGVGVFLIQRAPKENRKITWVQVDPVPKVAKESRQKRIVETSPGEKVAQAEPDAFLGAQTQRFDRQTVAKSKTAVSKHASSPKSVSKQDSKSKETSLGKLGLPMNSNRLKQGMDEPAWATPGTRAEDHVNGMTESDRTALNTKEYVFFSYFQRIRERLDRAWVPILRERLAQYYRSGRRLANDMEHTTKVLVVLNGKGEVIRVQLVSESGTRDLDESAVGAFNKAGPFPNPPQGMADANQEIVIPWDFILKT